MRFAPSVSLVAVFVAAFSASSSALAVEYRARPSGLVVLVFLVYWALASWWLRRSAKGAGK
jgi:hypothetical protein